MMNPCIISLPMIFPLYLDPGSGSFIIQMLLAGALGLGVGIRMYWAKIRQFFGGKRNDPAASEDGNED